MSDQNTAKQTLIDFATTFENLIGSQETVELLKVATDFAKENPTTVLELREEIIKDPESFKDMMRPQSISKIKGIISAVKSGGLSALMGELF